MKLLIIGDHPASTKGFARVVRNLALRLCGRFEVVVAGLNDLGFGDVFPFRVYGARHGAEFAERLPEIFRREQPDHVLMCYDFAICGQCAQALAEGAGGVLKTPVTVHTPADGGGVVPGYVEWVNAGWFDAPLSIAHYTRFGQEQFDAALRAVGRRFPSSVVGLAAEREMFYPVEKQLAREALADADARFAWLRSAKWVLLNATTNTYRKQIPSSIEGFAEFLQRLDPAEREGVCLWLHMNPSPPKNSGGWPLMDCAEFEFGRRGLDVAQHVAFTFEESPEGPAGFCEGNGVTEEAMNLIYNAADAGISTSGGEGWGLTVWEHAAVGRPQVVVDYAAFAEIFPRDGVHRIPPVLLDTAPESLLRFARVTAGDVADAIAECYRSPHVADVSGRSWDDVAGEILELVSSE